ncbi:MAG: hypothetical protein ACREUW_13345 [Burkholderiales bacterium]
MAKLFNDGSGALIGEISQAEMQFLIDQLEEEDTTDDDYFIDGDTVDMLEENGGPKPLIALLRAAVGDTEGIDVRWEK